MTDRELQRSHARWVLHCVQKTHDFDDVRGDLRSALVALAQAVLDLPDQRELTTAARLIRKLHPADSHFNSGVKAACDFCRFVAATQGDSAPGREWDREPSKSVHNGGSDVQADA